MEMDELVERADVEFMLAAARIESDAELRGLTTEERRSLISAIIPIVRAAVLEEGKLVAGALAKAKVRAYSQQQRDIALDFPDPESLAIVREWVEAHRST